MASVIQFMSMTIPKPHQQLTDLDGPHLGTVIWWEMLIQQSQQLRLLLQLPKPNTDHPWMLSTSNGNK